MVMTPTLSFSFPPFEKGIEKKWKGSGTPSGLLGWEWESMLAGLIWVKSFFILLFFLALFLFFSSGKISGCTFSPLSLWYFPAIAFLPLQGHALSVYHHKWSRPLTRDRNGLLRSYLHPTQRTTTLKRDSILFLSSSVASTSHLCRIKAVLQKSGSYTELICGGIWDSISL